MISDGLIAMFFSRYMVIACFCAVSNNIIMIAGDCAGADYPIMTLVSFMILTPVAYALHTFFTFTKQFSAISLLRFSSATALGLPLSLFSMAIWCTLLKLPVFIAAPITTAVLFFWNYASARVSILGRATGIDAHQSSRISERRVCRVRDGR
jgi:putative flippase GtrA